MTSTTKAVKITAKQALEGKYLNSVFAVMPFILAIVIISNIGMLLEEYTVWYIAMIFEITVSVFTVIPLFTGTVRFFRRLIWDADDAVVSVFHYFSNAGLYFRSIKLQALIILKTLPALIAVTLPYAAVKIFSEKGVYEKFGMRIPEFVSSLKFISYFLLAGAVISALFILLRYYMTVFLLVSDDGMTVSESIYMGRVISGKTSGDFFVLVLSFLHYIVGTLLLVLAPIALPVLFSSYCVHCRFAVSQYNLTVKKMNESSIPTFVEGE